MAKECWKKKKKETRKYFKCDKEGHIVKNCKEKQIKKQKVQEESDNKEDSQKDFGKDLEQVQYARSP